MPSPTRRDLLATGACAVGGSFVGYAALSRYDVETHADRDDWPARHHDTLHTNYNPAASGPTEDPSERWSVGFYASDDSAVQGYSLAPTPVVVGDVVFLGGSQLAAHRVADGRMTWRAGGEYTVCGLAYADEALYAVEQSRDEWAVTAVDVTFDDETNEGDATDRVATGDGPVSGTRRFRRPFDALYAWGPLVAGDAMFHVEGHEVVARSASDGGVRWRVPNLYQAVPPVATPEALYTQETGGGTALCRRGWRNPVDALTGAPPGTRWEADLRHANYLQQSPAAARDGERLFLPGSLRRHGGADDVARLSALTSEGRREWTKPVGTMSATPAVGPDGVYLVSGIRTDTVDAGETSSGAFDARVAAHDPETGAVRWKRRFEEVGDWQIPPVLADGVLYASLTNGDGRHLLRAFDADSGETLWSRALEFPAYHLAVVGETLFATTYDGVLHAFE